MNTRRWASAMLALATGLALVPGSSNTSAQAGTCGPRDADGNLEMIGLRQSGRLLCFDENGDDEEDLGVVNGTDPGDDVVGIDYRPATGDLYGLGDLGGIYIIDEATGAATKTASVAVPLAGSAFGIDFNPTVDLLRIISNTGQNLRVNVMTGATTVDGALNYNGVAATGLTAVGYANNDADADTGTALYDVDTNLNQLALQSPPNTGSLSAVGPFTEDPALRADLDLYSDVGGDGETVDNEAFAIFRMGGTSRLVEIAAFGGQANVRGSIVGQFVGLAIPLSQG